MERAPISYYKRTGNMAWYHTGREKMAYGIA